MSTRSELEKIIITWANAQTPKVPVAVEGVPFEPFTSGTNPFVSCTMLASTTINPTVKADRRRTIGTFQINVWVKDGQGSGQLERMVDTIVNLYPVIPKLNTVSIEQTPQTSQAFTEADWRIISISIRYRVEW